ncbi:MAG TPA: hypothetical protein VGM88_14900 [Kofleriaceae bacterium]|jgi:hypothetical protein
MKLGVCVFLVAMARVAAADTLDQRVEKLDHDFDTGDAFKPAVARAVELFGKPTSYSTSDKGMVQIEWDVEDKDMCFRITLSGHDGYLFGRHSTGNGGGTDDYKACHKLVGPQIAPPDIAEPAKYDVDKPAAQVLAAFDTGKWQNLWDGSDVDLQKNLGSPDGYQHFWSYFPPLVGHCTKMGAPIERKAKFYGWQVHFPAICDKGTLDAWISFTHEKSGGLVISDLQFNLPKSLQRRPADAEYAAFGKHAEEVLLGGDFGKFYDLMMIKLQLKITDKKGMGDQVREVAGNLGPISSIKVTKVETCEDGAARCLTLAVAGAKAKTTGTLTIVWAVSRFEIFAFNIDKP